VKNSEGGLVEFTDAVLDGLEVRLDRGQRYAHLVREIGEHPAAGGLVRAEAFCAGVESAGQARELAAESRVGHPRVIPAGSDLEGSDGDRGDGALDPSAEVPRDPECGGHCGEQRD
jgi:hypothetical protein